MDIIAIILGIVFLVKRRKVKTMAPTRFPGVAENDFNTWKKLELRRLAVFLWIVWIWIAFELIVLFPVYISSREESLLLVGWIALPVLIVAFVASSISGREARKMKNSFLRKSSLGDATRQ